MKEHYLKLKKSERILIYIMILVILAGGGSIMIRPMYQKYNKVSEQYDAIWMQKQMMDMDVNNYDATKALKEERQSFYEEHQNYLEPLAGESYVEQRISRFLESYSLKPDSILLEGGYNTEVSEYKGLDSQIEEEETEEIQLVDEEGDVVTDNQNGAEKLYQSVPFTMSVTGNLQQFCNLLDGCKKERALQITDFSIHRDNGTVSYNLYANEQLVFYISAVYYMKSY